VHISLLHGTSLRFGLLDLMRSVRFAKRIKPFNPRPSVISSTIIRRKRLNIDHLVFIYCSTDILFCFGSSVTSKLIMSHILTTINEYNRSRMHPVTTLRIKNVGDSYLTKEMNSPKESIHCYGKLEPQVIRSIPSEVQDVASGKAFEFQLTLA